MSTWRRDIMEPAHYFLTVIAIAILIIGGLAIAGVKHTASVVRAWLKRHIIEYVPPENEDVFDSEQRPKVHYLDDLFSRRGKQ